MVCNFKVTPEFVWIAPWDYELGDDTLMAGHVGIRCLG